jgi:hypothetical protein
MGFYWTTIFYSNINNQDVKIILASMDQIIDDDDIERGFVLKEELLNFFKTKVKKEDITEYSYLVEYSYDTYGSGQTETKRLSIK